MSELGNLSSNDLRRPYFTMKTLRSNIFNSTKRSGKSWDVANSPEKSKKRFAVLGTSLVVTGGVALWNNYYSPM